mgnify:CR=1 FL=1
MKELDLNETCAILNEILEYELAGVVRYTHYGLMVTGPYRQPIVDFMKAQAAESLTHAEQAGEIITGLNGHPSQSIAEIEESHKHDIRQILEESLQHELNAVELYRKLLRTVEGHSIYLEEFARTMVGQEELHTLEIRKMLRDYSVV